MRQKTEEIQQFIVDNLEKNERTIARLTADHFKISRSAVAKHMRALIDKKWLQAEGATKARTYRLLPIDGKKLELSAVKNLEEDVVWREQASPVIAGCVKDNVLTICDYGFTEMLNNVKEHSESEKAMILVGVDPVNVRIVIRDYGIGVFKKIMQHLNLRDPRHALLELTKGKLTTDAKGHTGQGIFFTSRMFDKFMLDANGFLYCRFNKEDEWLFEQGNVDKGTEVTMVISRNSPRRADNVFEEFASELHDYGFTKTHVILELARYEGEQLVSRSQAKRLLARVDQFKEVVLDFKGITTIGQGFADEIFRVFVRNHPMIRISDVNANQEVRRMIKRAKNEEVREPSLPLFEDTADKS